MSACSNKEEADVRNEDALVLSLLAHIDPCTLGNGEDVRGILVAALAAVLMYDGVGVERKGLVRIDGDQEEAGVCLDETEE